MSLPKIFTSADAGAPVLNNAVGSLIAVLDACLITGYGTKTITSINVLSGVATVVCTAHGFGNAYGKTIRVAGATPVELNGDTRIDNVTTDGFTFLCPGVPDGAATGSISAKVAPLDFVKQFSGTNLAMYKSGDVTATGRLLRIDDTAVGQTARAIMVHSATDINTYTNQSPSVAQLSGGQYWYKGYGTATAADWYLVGDGKTFYFFSRYSSSYVFLMDHGFGDMIDFKPASTLGCILFGRGNAGVFAASPFSASISAEPKAVVAGAKSGVAPSGLICLDDRNVNIGCAGPTYPSDVDGGFLIKYPALLSEGTADGHRRGIARGVAMPMANLTGVFSNGQIISNADNSEKFIVFNLFLYANSPATQGGTMLFNLSSDWD